MHVFIAYYLSALKDYKLHEDGIFFGLLMYLHVEQCLTHNRCSINIFKYIAIMQKLSEDEWITIKESKPLVFTSCN